MKRFLLIAAATGLSLPTFAGTWYTNESDFLSALKSDYYVETFQSANIDPAAPSTTFTDGNYEFTASAPTGLYLLTGDNNSLSTNTASEALSFSFNGTKPLNAFGGKFFGTDFVGNIKTTTVTVQMGDGASKTFQAAAPTFVGYITDNYETPLTGSSFTVTSVISTDILTGPVPAWATIDDVVVGQLPTPVPEPASVAALGLGALAFIRRRKA